MGRIHQFTETLHIVRLECLHRLQRAVVLVDSMACAPTLDGIGDCRCNGIELRIRQLAESLDRLYFLQCLQC